MIDVLDPIAEYRRPWVKIGTNDRDRSIMRCEVHGETFVRHFGILTTDADYCQACIARFALHVDHCHGCFEDRRLRQPAGFVQPDYWNTNGVPPGNLGCDYHHTTFPLGDACRACVAEDEETDREAYRHRDALMLSDPSQSISSPTA